MTWSALMPPVDNDEVLLTKFMLCGGYIWDASSKGHIGWFAIEPGCIESTPCHNTRGDTPQIAVRNFIRKFGAPWQKEYKSYASMLSADGPTRPPTA